MNFRKLSALSVFLLLSAGLIFAQRTEKSVEDEYLSSVEDVVITELVATSDYDSMLVALDYIEESVSGGSSSQAVTSALCTLASSGLTTVSRTGGRVVNNYPDIRARACRLLASNPCEEAKDTLLQVIQIDKEPMVLSAAVQTLGEMGINDDDEVVNAIEFVHNNMAIMNPTSSFALQVLNAYEKLSPSVQDKSAMVLSITQIATNYHYVKPVRDQAKALLKSIQNGGSSPEK